MAFTYTPYQKKQYQRSDAVTQAQEAVQQHKQNKPGDYQSQWQKPMEDILAQYQNRKPFDYDINADAMYQQMVDRYMQQGKQAMMDTIGQAASLTGGYGNSYAQMVGQQAYNGYLQGVTDKIPEYYKMALDRYQAQGDELMQRYSLLAAQEDAAYGRYTDQVNRYYSELDRLQDAYDSERDYDYSRFMNDQEFDFGLHTAEQNYGYQADRDAAADAQWDKQWAYEQERDQVEDNRYNQQLAQAQVDQLLAMGADIPESLISASGYDPAYIAAIRAASAAPVVSYGGGGGGSSGSGNRNVDLVSEATWLAKKAGTGAAIAYVQDQVGSSAAGKLGSGKSPEAIKAMDNAKGVSMTEHYKKMLAAQSKK